MCAEEYFAILYKTICSGQYLFNFSAALWLKPPKDDKKKKTQKPGYFSGWYIMNNLRQLIFLLVYLLINVALSAVSIWRNWNANYCIIIARFCGMCLNFNCSFNVVFMLRYCLSWLRSTPAAYIFRFDDSVLFHKMIGMVIFVQSVVHTAGHLGNIGKIIVNSTNDQNK